ncbi:hypothetical protein KFK09_010694 [Dendrobium nobile]|uniref:Uncharacterized protein n=1 Tax=Dendrobium nobile TaxID=94219 RepID=A0A8T3BCG0_DENNO|nr:hypothetical protein KFK09_010694 [Dendrobium nobile]
MEQLGGPLHLQATAASACAMVMNKRIYYLRGGNVNLSHNLSLFLSALGDDDEKLGDDSGLLLRFLTFGILPLISKGWHG